MSLPAPLRDDDDRDHYIRRLELRDTDHAILDVLEDGPASTKDIAANVDASEKYVSERTTVMRSAGILDRMPDPRSPRRYLHFRTDADCPLTDIGFPPSDP